MGMRSLDGKFSLKDMPEVFVSDASISKAVSAAVARGDLRKLASRLYTRNLEEDPERLVRRHWIELIPAYFPDALITDRTGLENRPAPDGSVCLVSGKTRNVEMPGLVFRPRRGPGPLKSDRPFPGGIRLASIPRAYLENMRPSRGRGERLPRTLSRAEIEERLDELLRRQGEGALNRLRDEAREIAPQLGLVKEFEKFNELAGTLLGTRTGVVQSAVGKARVAGSPVDPGRIQILETLFAELRETLFPPRVAPERSPLANANLCFFEAYFSNFIEGTEFEIEEAKDIVFGNVIPPERPDDAHDILGTYQIVSDPSEMKKVPADFDEFVEILQRRHAGIMQARADKNPGTFKTKINRAGETVFVHPDLVIGTLEHGFAFLQALAEPFQRAAFIMVLVSEVHPFADGNGRVARIMMNAELVAEGQERIIIPTAYRTDYLGALKALSHNRTMTPVIRMLDYAQRYTHAIDWNDFDPARRTPAQTGAFGEGEHATLRMPGGDAIST